MFRGGLQYHSILKGKEQTRDVNNSDEEICSDN